MGWGRVIGGYWVRRCPSLRFAVYHGSEAALALSCACTPSAACMLDAVPDFAIAMRNAGTAFQFGACKDSQVAQVSSAAGQPGGGDATGCAKGPISLLSQGIWVAP